MISPTAFGRPSTGREVRPCARTASLGSLALALLLAATAPSIARAQTHPAPPPELTKALDGVSELVAVGSPGGITLFGPRAWALVVGGEVPVVAAAAGEGKRSGRILAFSQDGYLEPGPLAHSDTRRFLQGALRWLAGGKRRPTLVRLGGRAKPFAEALSMASSEEIAEADVLLLTSDGLKSERLGEVRRFLAAGGGVLCATTPWGWKQIHAGATLAHDSTLNRLMAPFGLAFDGRLASKTTPHGFAVVPPGELEDLLHADRAWAALSGDAPLTPPRRSIALDTLDAAAEALDDFEPRLLLPMRRFAADPSNGEVAQHLARRFAALHLAPIDVRFGNWWIAGPFPAGSIAPGERPLGKPLPIEAELERCAAGGEGPRLRREWKVRGGKLPWRRVELAGWGRAPDVGSLDLFDLGGRDLPEKARAKAWQRDASLFLYRSVDLEEPRSLAFSLEALGGVGLWIDGALLASSAPADGAAELDAEVRLGAGRHHIWLRTSHAEGPWRVRMSQGETFSTAPVDAAIDAGVRHLLERQYIDGSWAGDEGYGPGNTAMTLFALAKCGLPATHPAVVRAMAYLAAHRAEHVYSLSAKMLALAELDPDARAFLGEGVKRLISWQASSGLWAYPVHPSGSHLPDDLSNALFVALAFDAAAERGVEVPSEPWLDLVEGTFDCGERNKSGPTSGLSPLGFAYRPHGTATGSMTVAALTCLVLARTHLGDALRSRNAKRIDRAVERGLAWLDHHMDFSSNPQHNAWQYFWIYGIERTGSLLEARRLGGVDWYRTGAEYLVAHQKDDGGWSGGHPTVDTPLALLFLKRATAPTSGDRTPWDWRLVSSDPAEMPGEGAPTVIAHARRPHTASDPLECWIELDKGAPPPTRVVWEISGPGGATPLAEIDAAHDRGRGTFALRATLPTPESIELVARLEFPSGESVQTSPISLPARYRPEALRIAPLVEANLLRGAETKATSASDRAAAERAIDGSCTTNWIPGRGAREATWSAELAKPAQATRLILLPSNPSPEHAGDPRVTRARVTIDGELTFEAELSPDPMRPTTIEFDREVRVHRVDVAVLATTADRAAGFSEVLLLP